MAKYSRQFTQKLIELLDQDIKDYYIKQCQHYKFPETTIEGVVDAALDEYFQGCTAKDDLVPLIEKLAKKRKNKRYTTYKGIIRDAAAYDYQDKLNPFNSYYEMSFMAPDDQFLKMYHASSFDDVAHIIMDKVEEWYKDKGLLINCPCVTAKTSKRVYDNILSDIAHGASIYIAELDYDINNYFRKYPQDLIDKPLFGVSSAKVSPDFFTSEFETRIYKEIIADPDGSNALSVSYNVPASDSNAILRTLSTQDLELMNSFLTFIPDTSTFVKESIVHVTLGELSKRWLGRKINSTFYEQLKAASKRLVGYEFSIQNNTSFISFSLFDNISVNLDVPEPYAEAKFGSLLTDAIIHERLISVTNDQVKLLQDNMSKILCYALKREQISHQDIRDETYDYLFFNRRIRFPKGTKKAAKIKLILKSLDDFVANNIIIDSYEYESGKFNIHYLPLTQPEKEDLAKEL